MLVHAFSTPVLFHPGNLLTIVALPMSKTLRTTATAFVVNLALVELMFCVFVLPLSGAQYAYLAINDGESLRYGCRRILPAYIKTEINVNSRSAAFLV